MKVYVLIEKIYNYDSGEENTSYIDGVYYKKEDCKKKMQEEIKHNLEDFNFIEDSDNATAETKPLLIYKKRM